MKELFFFDDWMLKERQGLDRTYGQPERKSETIIKAHPELRIIRGITKIEYDKEISKYVAYMDCHQKSDNTRFNVRMEAEDPDNWPELQFASGGGPMWKRVKNGSVIVDQHGNPVCCYSTLSLKGTPLAEKGYFMNPNRYKNNKGQYIAAVAFSKDQKHIDVDDKTSWITYCSDTGNYTHYDPKTGQFLIYCRPDFVDRRVAVVTSTDLKTFSKPTVILQPDSEDPVGREFYAMDYMAIGEDMYVGILLLFDTELTEKSWPKMQGTLYSSMVYSYNRINWYRSSRKPFIPRPGAGAPSGGGQAVASLPTLLPDNTLNTGFMCTAVDHGADTEKDIPEEWQKTWKTYQYRMRLDGFVYLRTRARLGKIQTKAVIPDGGEMTINTCTGMSGYVKVAVLDDKTLEPVKNFTLDDCIPVKGDELFGKVCWRNRDTLDELKGRTVVFEVQVKEGELYALRFSYKMPIPLPA